MFEKEAEEWYVILNMNCRYEICKRCSKSGLFKGSLKECDDWIKQKQKDEIKDKISMALKDPILRQGFEIICKENNENVEMKKQLTKAKEIIKDYLTIVKGSHTTVCGVPEENRTIYILKLNKEAEQFLNGEVEKLIESQ